MSKIESSLSKRLTAHARQVGSRATLKGATLVFPSYLRVFHVFTQHFSSELRRGSIPLMTGFFGQLPGVPARVAFV
jgi:hypothetical protein